MNAINDSPSSRLAGKVALVTGAASGIGRATAVLMARQGARVGVADVDQQKAEQTAAEIRDNGGTSRFLPLDVTSREAWDAAIASILGDWKALDVLVNCAGISDDAPLEKLTLEQWRHVFSVNLEGTFLGTAAAIRAMNAAGRGSIVNVSSISGIKASPGAAAYCASKAGVIQLTRVAALECANAGKNIRVNCVVPGGVKTPMWEKTPLWPDITASDEWKAPPDAPSLKRFADPREIAQAILFLASDESSYITGEMLVVDGAASV